MARTERALERRAAPFRSRRAQAILETMLSMLFLTTVLLVLFQLSQRLLARTMLDHAAACAARARAVGFNDYMCLKTARAAMIPVAGRRYLPEAAGEWEEAALIPHYLSAPDEAHALAVLDYERWHTTRFGITSGVGDFGRVRASLDMATDDFDAEGRCEIESHYPLYMDYAGR